MRNIVKQIIKNLPYEEPQGTHEEVETLTFLVELENLYAEFSVEVTTYIENLFCGDWDAPDEYISKLQVGEPKVDQIYLNNENFYLTAHEWKEVGKEIINNIDTHSYDGVQN